MRKFNYLMSIIALGAVLTTSCSDDSLEVLNPAEVGGSTGAGEYPITITASAPTSDTKVAIDGYTVLWEDTDALTVAKMPDFLETGKFVAFSEANRTKFGINLSTISGNTADFTGSFTNDAPYNEYIYAVSPHIQKENAEGVMVDVTYGVLNNTKDHENQRIVYTFNPSMIQEHKYKNADLELDSKSISPYVLMYGQSKEAVDGTADIDVDMKHLMTYFDFEISGMADKSIDSLVITTPRLFASTARYNCYPLKSSRPAEIAYTSTTSISVKLFDHDGNNGVTLSSGSDVLTVRVAACISEPTTGTEWAVSGYNGDDLIGSGGKLVDKEFIAGGLYTAEITLTAPTEIVSITKTEGQKLATSTDIRLITKLTVTGGGTLDSTDFAYIGGMVNLNELDLSGAKVDSISAYAFQTTKLSSITLPAGLLKIESNAFIGTKLTSIKIPSAVKEIGYRAFYNCESLATVTFGASSVLEILGGSIFQNCASLTGVSFTTSSIKVIPASTFSNCTSLTNINQCLPSSGVDSLGNNVFQACIGLTTVDLLAKGIKKFGTELFLNCTGLTSVTLPAGITKIPNNTFEGCTSFGTIPTISATVTELGNGVFRGCTGLTGVVDLPTTITKLGTGIFNGCTSLTGATFSSSITIMPNGMFIGCTSLTQYTIPATIKRVGNYVFQNTGLTNLTVPAGVTNLGQSVFNGSNSLVTITFERTQGTAIATNTFGVEGDTPELTDIFVPVGSSVKYQTTGNWRSGKVRESIRVLVKEKQ